MGAVRVSTDQHGPAPSAQREQLPRQGGNGEAATVSAVVEAQRPERPKVNYQRKPLRMSEAGPT